MLSFLAEYTSTVIFNKNPKICMFIFDYLAFFECYTIRGMFEMNCLLSSSSLSTWGTIKTNIYLYSAIQYLHNGV